jgi:hypothetical protein
LSWLRFTILLLIALFAANVYRAATQNVAIDEAFTYSEFLAGPLSDLLNKYNANHHILNSMLTKLSISLFGLSEFTLRLPSLLCGLLYLIVSFRLCRLLFGEGWQLPFSFALLTMSPGVLDYLSAARGYGMAMAFLLLAIWQMVRYDGGPGRLERAAVCLAACVAANIAFAFACIPLAVVFALTLRRDEAIDRFLVPGLVVAFAIMVLPLTHVSLEKFYAGLPTLRASLESVFWIFLFHDPSGGTAARIFNAVLPAAGWLFPIVIALGIALCVRQKPFRELSPVDRALRLTTAALAGSIALLAVGHRFGILYPIRRTGVYWIPLAVLMCLTLAAKIPRSQWRLAVMAPGLVCILQFLLQWNVHHYMEWPYDFDTKRAVRRMAEDHKQRPLPKVNIQASWSVQPALNFYGRKYRWSWLQLNWTQAPGPQGDYYVLQGQDTALVENLGLTKLYENESAHLVLAVPKR